MGSQHSCLYLFAAEAGIKHASDSWFSLGYPEALSGDGKHILNT